MILLHMPLQYSESNNTCTFQLKSYVSYNYKVHTSVVRYFVPLAGGGCRVVEIGQHTVHITLYSELHIRCFA